MMRIAALLSLLCSTPGSSLAQVPESQIQIYLTGTQITEKCRSYLSLARNGMATGSPQQAYDAGACWAFVVGVADSIEHEGLALSPAGAADVCLPRGINASILVEMVARYADAHPAARSMSGYGLTRAALHQTYACGRQLK
jgi:hypothetical protein